MAIPWGAIGAVASAGVSGTLGLGGGALQAEHSKELQEDQQDFIKWQMQNRYQLQRTDLEAAGLNPLLAYGQQPPVVAGGIGPGIENPLKGAASAAKDVPIIAAQIKKANADAKDANASAGAHWSQDQVNSARVDMVKHETKLLELQRANAQAESDYWTKMGWKGKLAEKVAAGARDVGIGLGGVTGGISKFIRPGTRTPTSKPGPWVTDPRAKVPFRRPAR